MDRRIKMIDSEEEPAEEAPVRVGGGASVLDVDSKGNTFGSDLDSYFLRRRIIRLYVDVNEYSMADLQAKLQYLESTGPKEPIHLYINSPGGSVIHALSAYDTMTSLSCPVYTYANGYAASAGSLLFQAGSAGHRYILPNALVMIHQLRGGGSNGPFTDQKISMALSEHLEQRLEKIYAHHTGKPLATIEKWLRNGDRWLTAQEAVEAGLADSILDKTIAGDPSRGFTTQERLQEAPPKPARTRRTGAAVQSKGSAKVSGPAKGAQAPEVKGPDQENTGQGLA